jgi:hypothetical protein
VRLGVPYLSWEESDGGRTLGGRQPDSTNEMAYVFSRKDRVSLCMAAWLVRDGRPVAWWPVLERLVRVRMYGRAADALKAWVQERAEAALGENDRLRVSFEAGE